MLNDPLGEAIKLSFGFPDCMVDLTKDILSILPGDILGGIAKGIGEGRDAAQDCIAGWFEEIHDALGILEYDSTTGHLSLLGNSSQAGVDGQADNFLSTMGNFFGAIAGGGMALYQAYEDVADQIEAYEACWQDWQDMLEAEQKGEDSGSGEGALTRTKGEFLVLKAQITAAQEYVDKANKVLGDISTIMGERAEDPSLIPILAPVNTDLVDLSPIFRLTFGPPKAKTGQYLLSVDGIYYDSQTRTYADGSPVPTVEDLTFIPAKDRWRLDHSPNLGGRGTAYSLKDLDAYVDTLFDIKKIDNTTALETYYADDHYLQVLETQRNQTISNLTKNIVELQTLGYGPDSALHINYTQQIKSQNAAFNKKINKRKKQIEVAVKAPDLFGSETYFSPGQVPINDFSFLSSINLDVEVQKQRNLSFDHGEISGIVLPIAPTYVHSQGISDKVVLTPLEVAPIGVGSNIDGESLEDVSPQLSLTTNIVTHGLKAIYNFADVNIQSPSSLDFKTLNCIAEGTYDRAQTVSTNLPLLFQKGLGIPYLAGIPQVYKKSAGYEFFGETWSTYPFSIRGAGNYIKLPDTSSYQNLLYSNQGATIDLWTYIPGLSQQEGPPSGETFLSHPYDTSAFGLELSSAGGKWCDMHYYRVLLGCENTGGDNQNLDQSSIVVDRGSINVRGMLMGFSRDPRMYYENGIVNPGSTDLNPRENYGGYVTSVSSVVSGVADSNGDSGDWIISSLPNNPLPEASYQASGTWKSKNIDGVAKSVEFTLNSGGDKYPLSSNDACCVIYVSGDDSFRAGYALSSTLSIAPFNGNYQAGTGSSVFFIAPTQSYNTSSVGFVRPAGCRVNSTDILKFVVSTDKIVGSTSFSDIKSKFVNLQIVFDPPNDALKFYINGVLFKESALSDVFDVTPHSAPQLPSFMLPKSVSTSSFYYSETNVTQETGISVFNNGPNTYPQFTPWVVGGGWTDGRPVDLATSSGGFLDTGAGVISSYNGYLGNLKIYNTALNTTELTKNYEAQKLFFENIDLTYYTL